MLTGGNCYLGISTSEDSDIYIEGKKAGTTNDEFIAFKRMKAGSYTVEALTKYKKGTATIGLKDRDVKRIKIKMESMNSGIRALSDIGEYKITVCDKTYDCPAFINALPSGKHTMKVTYKDVEYEKDIELLPGTELDYDLTKEELEIQQQTSLITEDDIEALLEEKLIDE
ncbi:MAG: hypothetical protein HQK89_17615 [Nitrospirae bacterium]|nr:hypothetical protein [Nitrospirota bacterium]